MAKKAALSAVGLDAEFQAELAKSGIAGIFKKIPDRSDMSVECVSTGLPRLDKILHSEKLGWPRGRDIEIYSKVPEVGKTTLGLDILRSAQAQGLKTAIVDIENTITDEYLIEQRIILDPDVNPDVYVPYLAKAYDPDTGTPLSAEDMLNAIGAISKIADLVLVDSMPGLAKKADLEKDANDPTAPGGIGKLMFEHIRRNLKKKATVIWINQARVQIGGYNPTGNTRYKTAGGDAVPFFGSIRLELALVEKMKRTVGKEEDIYGVKVDVFTAKNKISPPYRHVLLTYLNGRGFDPIWDLFESAKKAEVIAKSGSWLSFGDFKAQGDQSFYQQMIADPAFASAIDEALIPTEPIEESVAA